MQTTKLLKNVPVRDCVNLHVSQLDRGLDNCANIIGFILDIKEGMYEINMRGERI